MTDAEPSIDHALGEGTYDGTPLDPAATGTTVVEEQRSSRLPLVLASVGAVLVLAAALVAPLVDRVLRGDEEAERALDLSLVETWEITDRTHTTGDVAYPQTPPAGGPHAPVWLACGVYDEPVRDENAVHDLEHGTVWITHDPDLSADDVERLAADLPDNGIMSPREGLPSEVVVTVWGAQLQLDGADDGRLALFLEEYGDGHTAPEFGVTCQGGTPDPQGGLPEQGANA
ncbi:DUF3105 domain-containing protein [Microbacterium sp. ARD31]|uniref:DUF3105 domain-containing protein n=1 Tax=Microbacterium sp. ARD31 TaxID=2962576 RepID=UPI00288276B5|nr:DUF3105 domain-containing protein [Microbacterium sp. ARD31]MDT0186747.1 DUF3105 domain-containing protein [Microbacterium sp. ARD31]